MTVRLVSMDASSHAWPKLGRPQDQIQERKAVGWLGRGVVALGLYQPLRRPSFFGVARTTANLRCLGWTTAMCAAAAMRGKRQAVVLRRDGGVAAAGGNVPGHALL